MTMKLQKLLNNFLSNVTKALGIPQNIYSYLFIADFDNPILSAILKYHKTF